MSLIPTIKSWFRSLSKKERPLISVVLLLRELFQLTDDRLHAAIVKAWGRDLRPEANEYMVNKPHVYFIRFNDVVLLINNIARSYVSEEYRQQKASREFKDLRHLKVVME